MWNPTEPSAYLRVSLAVQCLSHSLLLGWDFLLLFLPRLLLLFLGSSLLLLLHRLRMNLLILDSETIGERQREYDSHELVLRSNSGACYIRMVTESRVTWTGSVTFALGSEDPPPNRLEMVFPSSDKSKEPEFRHGRDYDWLMGGGKSDVNWLRKTHLSELIPHPSPPQWSQRQTPPKNKNKLLVKVISHQNKIMFIAFWPCVWTKSQHLLTYDEACIAKTTTG